MTCNPTTAIYLGGFGMPHDLQETRTSVNQSTYCMYIYVYTYLQHRLFTIKSPDSLPLSYWGTINHSVVVRCTTMQSFRTCFSIIKSCCCVLSSHHFVGPAKKIIGSQLLVSTQFPFKKMRLKNSHLSSQAAVPMHFLHHQVLGDPRAPQPLRLLGGHGGTTAHGGGEGPELLGRLTKAKIYSNRW